MRLNDKLLRITCDGGAATGKSTGAKLIAKKYKLAFLSSGLLYRYASFLILKYAPKNKISFLKRQFKNLNYKKIVKKNLHTPKISSFSSVIAKNNNIRKILKNFQLKFVKKYKNCCIEGRDISTKILPNSNLKFFFVCNLNIAATRRFKELKKRNPNIKLKDVKKALRVRNISDTKRKNSPLLKHKNSIVINSGKYTKKAMLAKMTRHVENMLNNYGN